MRKNYRLRNSKLRGYWVTLTLISFSGRTCRTLHVPLFEQSCQWNNVYPIDDERKTIILAHLALLPIYKLADKTRGANRAPTSLPVADLLSCCNFNCTLPQSHRILSHRRNHGTDVIKFIIVSSIHVLSASTVLSIFCHVSPNI